MIKKKLTELSEHFEDLTIKKQMKILAYRAAKSKLFFKEIMEEFEKTLLIAVMERNDYNMLKVAMDIKLHRNTIAQKMEKLKIREKKKKKK